MSASDDFVHAVEEAERHAAVQARPLATMDLLLGALHSGSAACHALAERGISSSIFETQGGKVQKLDRVNLAAVTEMGHAIAIGLGAPQTTSLHLLLAILRCEGSASEVVGLAGLSTAKLRGIVMRALTGPGARAQQPTALPVPDELVGGAGPRPRWPGRALDSLASEDQGEPGVTMPGWSLVAIPPPQVAILHREREVGRLLDLLAARTARVVLVVGESGSGRSAVLAALSAVSLEPPLVPVGDFGAPSPGALLQMIHRRAPAACPVALEGAAWLGPEGSDGVVQLLATAAAGRRWIMTMSPADLRRLETATPDFANQCETLVLADPEPAVALEMVEAGLDGIAATGAVDFAPEVASPLLRLSARYPSERAQPGRALAIAELAAARAVRLGQREVGPAAIAAVIADAAGVPAQQLLRNDDDRFRSLEERLADRVVGHGAARASIAASLRRSYAGFRGYRPLASFLLLGPTGVGKTETARAIAEALFDGQSALVRIDLSEYSEAHAVARLIGSPPGYLAHEEGGQLTEAVRRRPAVVVLLDELEKASREVLLVLLQVLEDGRLTDGRGRTVNFTSAAIVMTSNLGSELYRGKRVPSSAAILALARSKLPPELWNRIDEVLCYAPLSDRELAAVVERIARASSCRLQAERGISFQIDKSVIDEVLRREVDRSLGARPLRRSFERLVEDQLATEIVAGRLARGTRVEVAWRASGELAIRAMPFTSTPA